MVTLKTFTRSLEPITIFDDGGLSDFSAVSGSELVGFRTSSPVMSYEDDVTNVVLNGVLGLLCDQYASHDAQNKNRLFQLIAGELRKHIRIRPISNAYIQRQVRNGISRLLQAGADHLSELGLVVTRGQDLTSFMTTHSIDSRSLVRFQQPLSSSRLPVQPSLSIVDCISVSSKLADEFEDIKPLADGSGGFGKVYTARKISDDVIYAIKKIKIDADDRYATGMHREVESLSRLSHPNIVRYYDSWQGVEFKQQESDVDSEDESESSHCSSRPKVNEYPALRCYLYIHMELCEMTLKGWLEERLDHAVDYDKSYEIAKQILEGIEYMHSKNWFHRDLKPLNIFLSGDSPTNVPNIKIGDFGLARQTSSDSYERDSSPQVNEFSANIGTPMYGAPEQLTGSAYSMESDLFSVGLILYELYYLFKTDSEKVNTFSNLRKGIMDKEFKSSRPVEALIIEQLTAKDPSVRPPAREVLLDLHGSRRRRDIANADLVCNFESMSAKMSELKKQIRDRDVQLSKKDEQLMQKDAEILTLKRKIAEFEALQPLRAFPEAP